MTHLTAEDFDAIENCVLPTVQLLEPPYNDPFNTARLRLSMMGVPLKPLAMMLLSIRYERFMVAPEFTEV
jgi:hypothetical protein